MNLVVIPRLRKSWISAHTLHYIDDRSKARTIRDYRLEASLNKLIKKSVKQDRKSWLHKQLSGNNWSEIKKLRKGVPVQQGRLKDQSGHIVSSEHRSETMALHFEKIQWAVRPASAVSALPSLYEELPVNLNAITKEEVLRILKKLHKNKAPGHDNLHPEFWKICSTSEKLLTWITNLCNQIWQSAEIPTSWHIAKIACLYKKGDPAMPDNYRPISLLPIGYKIFSSLLLQRLKDAGAEHRIQESQYGFKSGTGTRDAIFFVRRLLDACATGKNQQLMLLALDWAKAFDSVSPAALAKALSRFGVPNHFVTVVEAIYKDRQFFVSDSFSQSAKHPQMFGISQGCPLSPFLFVIMMTVLMNDAKHDLVTSHGAELAQDIVCHECLYADDTLLIDVYGNNLQLYMECVAEHGKSYGLSLNWNKVECMPINCESHLHDPDGKLITSKSCLKYLGVNLHADASIDAELNQKLGLAS